MGKRMQDEHHEAKISRKYVLADITSFVLLVWAVVDQALSLRRISEMSRGLGAKTTYIVNISVRCITSKRKRIFWILEVEENKTSSALIRTRSSSNGYTVFELLVDNNVVTTSNWKSSEDALNVLLVGPRNRCLRGFDGKKLISR